MFESLIHCGTVPLSSILALAACHRSPPAPLGIASEPAASVVAVAPALTAATAAGATADPPEVAGPEDAGHCPSLDGFLVAASDEGGGAGARRWLLHEVLVQVPSEPVATTEEHPIGEPEARARGASSSDAPVWLLNPGAAPCRMKPGGFVLQRHNIGPQFERVARLLEGPCAHPGRTLAFQRQAEPARCRFPQTKEMAAFHLPDELVPVKPCKPPGCRYNTRISGGAMDGGAVVVSIVATWLHPTREPECNWAHDDIYRVFARTSSGAPLVEVPDVQLMGALVDDRGLRAVVGDSQWTMTVVPIGATGQPEPALAVTTHVHHEEDREWNSLARYCGP